MRTIDADNLKADIVSFYDLRTIDGITSSTVLRQVLRDIDNAPTIYPAGRYDSKRANQILEKIEEIAREAFSSPVTGDINLYRAQKLADIFAIFEYDGATVGLDPSSKSEETEDGQMDIYEAIAEAEKEE